MKAWLYLKSRARRHVVRERITSLVSDDLRLRKTALLNAATKLDTSKKNSATDDDASGNNSKEEQ